MGEREETMEEREEGMGGRESWMGEEEMGGRGWERMGEDG